ncbi:MAG: phospholipase D family protein [Mesorhizobium amorphae]|nr:MAG: phospholipase D family protein [Mesorhizobium amorphae]
MPILGVIVLIAAGFALASTLAVYSYGRFAKRAKGEASFALPLEEDATELDRSIAPRLKSHAGESGMMLVEDNLEAFALRALSARAAGRSLDLLYYYWKKDLTGSMLAREVLAAADRGVRVRILIDDINTRPGDRSYLALDSHENIEVRLFNPSLTRASSLKRGIELALRAFRATRRMHNKAWIADGRLAIVGGRNIGDAYFDAHDTSNFRDLDLALLGEAVASTARIFDNYWNSAVVLPVRALHGVRRQKADGLARLRGKIERTITPERAKPYLERLRADAHIQALVAGHNRYHWTREVQVLSDPPEKAVEGAEGDWLGPSILSAVGAARRSVAIASPYFIPGDRGVAMLGRLREHGVGVTVLTNSLAATDVVAVHGAYARYRRRVVETGVELYELKPEMRRQKLSIFGSSGASLHTKAFAVDEETGFVGSFNFDPRSLSLNTEMGVLFRHPALAAEILKVFTEEAEPQNSFRLALDGKRVVWKEGASVVARREPGASLWRRLSAGTIGLLPIESQL